MTRKVLFTASTFSHIRNFHLPYLRWFREQGWEVHAACGGEEQPIPGADRVIPLPFQKRMASPENFRAAAMLRKLIQEEGYALISTHTSLAAFFTRLAVKGMRDRPKMVNTVHGYLFDDGTPAIRRQILLAAERLTAPETDLLLTMNRWDCALAQQEKLGRQVVLIPGMGVDFSRLDGYTAADGKKLRATWNIPEDAFVLIYPAEFSERKSQEVLLEALAKLPEACVLALPGEGTLRERCREKAAALGLSGRVAFPGQVEDIGRWYAMADAAVSASRSEGLPFHLMEAMHCSLPAAASNVKGHTDLLEDGVTGLLYPYGDADACAAAVRRLMDAPALRESLGRNARQSAERYALERVMPEVTEALVGVMGEMEP